MPADIARYFDNAATTQVDPRVVAEMMPFFAADFGNPHSLHAFGKRAEEAVELARSRVAQLLGAEDPSQIVFVAGATEANNWVLRAFPGAAVSPFEHSSIYETARQLGLPWLRNEGLALYADRRHPLVSVMAVNNEIGTIWDVRSWRAFADFLHSDLTQAAGKLPVTVEGLDYASISAHKFYGPKGIGALYAREHAPPPFMTGGDQEHGRRAGTLNVPGIVGMGAAAAIALDDLEPNLDHAATARATIEAVLRGCSDLKINGGSLVSPYILSLSFLGVEGETLVIELDRLGFAISSGAACSSRSTEPSHVLKALNMEHAWLRGTVRISIGKYNDCKSCEKLGVTLLESVEKLRRML